MWKICERKNSLFSSELKKGKIKKFYRGIKEGKKYYDKRVRDERELKNLFIKYIKNYNNI